MKKAELLEKINNKSAVIGIVGLGYVGLPLLLRFAYNQFKVIGFDIDAEKIVSINSGKSYINHIDGEQIRKVQQNITATSDFSLINKVDAIILCVPTPLTKYREPDLSYITATMDSCFDYFRSGQVISLESTTYPGTTEEVIEGKIVETKLKVGTDFFIIYSPEREDPGNLEYHTSNIPKVCSGITKNCLEVGVALYKAIIEKVIPVSSPKVAEMTKLLENIHRAVNIGLVNEMKIVADHMNIDINEVIDAAATKPFGFVPYYPGPGIGGHCIPIDPFYLTWKAREFGLHTRFIELAGEVNANMPKWVINKTVLGLNKYNLAMKDSKILLLGLAYKPDVDDVRESPSIQLLELLLERGAIVDYHDTYVPNFPRLREHDHDLNSVAITEDSLKKYACIIISTAHSNVNYELIQKHAKLIIDTRGIYKGSFDNVISA